jgi:hypothetical protein
MLTAVALGTVLTFAQAQEKTVFGLPARLRSLTDLSLLDPKTLTEQQRTEVLLTWLVEEKARPSKPSEGFGGTINSEYILAQIVRAMHRTDDKAILWLATSPRLRSGFVRTSLNLAIGRLAIPSVVDSLLHTTLNDPNPQYRALAAMWLYEHDDPRIDSVLQAALEDTFARTIPMHVDPTNSGATTRVWRPVVEAAQQSIKNRQRGTYLEPERAAQRAKELADVQAGYDDFVHANRAYLERLLAIANAL